MSARSLMRACDGAEHGGTVAPDAKIASFSAEHRRGRQAVRGGQRHRQADRRGDAASGDRSAGRHRRTRSRRMTVAARRQRRRRPRPVQHLAARLGRRRLPPCWCVFLLRDSLPWAVNYPAGADRAGRRLGQRASWAGSRPTCHWLTRSITAVLGVPLRFRARPAGQEFQDRARRRAPIVLPRLSWVGVCRRRLPRRPRRRRPEARRCWSAAASSTSRCSANGPAPC